MTLRFWLSIQKIDPNGPEFQQIQHKTDQGYAALQVMETHITQNTYFLTSGLSIADISLYAYTHVAKEGGFDLQRFPAIRRWLCNVAATPGHIAIELHP
jgi:glutathione S-transferase